MISVFAVAGRNEDTHVFETQWAELIYLIDRFCFSKSVSTPTAIEGLLRKLGCFKTPSHNACMFSIVNGRAFSYAIVRLSSLIKLMNFRRRKRD